MTDDKNEILSKMRNIDPHSFESLLADLWSLYGYDTETTSGSSDKGIDIRASRNFPYKETVLIQAKRYGEKSAVSSPEMQKYASLSQRDGVDIVIVASTGEFTKQAREIAEDFNIKCVGANQLVQMILEEDAADLVNEYVSETNSGSNFVQDNKSTKPKPETKPTTALSETNHGIIELVGFDYLQSQSLMLYFVDLTNKTAHRWTTVSTVDFSVISTEGYEHSPGYSGSYNALPSPWQSPKSDVSENSTARMILPFASGSEFRPRKLQFEKKIYADDDSVEIKISTTIGQQTRENLAGFPDSVAPNDISIQLR